MKKSLSLTLAIALILNVLTFTPASSAASYRLTFHDGGGTSHFIIPTVGQPITATVTRPQSENGDIFGGFYTQPDGRGILYYCPNGNRAFHEPWAGAGDVALIAHWVSAPYIIFNHMNGSNIREFANAPDASGGHNLTMRWTPQTVSKPAPPTVFHEFAGYYEQLNGQGREIFRADGNNSSSTIAIVGNSAEIYAHFIITKYALIFDNHGGSLSENMVVPTATNQGGRFGRLPENVEPPTRTGYTFDGYFSAQNGGANEIVRLYNSEGLRVNDITIRGFSHTDTTPLEHTIHAVWRPNTYTIMFERAGGTGGALNAPAIFGQAPENVARPTRAGHDFVGYFTEENGEGVQYFDENGAALKPWETPANTTLFAHWLARCAGCGELQKSCVCVYCHVCEKLKDDCICVNCDGCDELKFPHDECVCEFCADCKKLSSPRDNCVCIYCEICEKLEENCICVPEIPTDLPTEKPTEIPTDLPTEKLIEKPTDEPTEPKIPTDEPTEIVTYEIDFNANGGAPIAPIRVENGVVTELPTPTRAGGFGFVGWFLPGSELRAYTIGDALEILKMLAGMTNAATIAIHDVTGDGKITVHDALEILKQLAGMDNILDKRPLPEPITAGFEVDGDTELVAWWQPIPPAVPANFRTSPGAVSGSVLLFWGGAEFADGYEVFRANSRVGEFTRIGVINERYVVTFADRDAGNSRNFYMVRAFRDVDGKRIFGERSEAVEGHSRG
jgi:hypothetical protein